MEENMAIWDDVTKGPVPMLIGLGVAIAAPTVIPAVGAGLRPLAKGVVRTVLTVYDAVREEIAEAAGEINGLVTEARAGMAQGARELTNQDNEENVATGDRPHRRRYRG
jgi:hypothetical protein